MQAPYANANTIYATAERMASSRDALENTSPSGVDFAPLGPRAISRALGLKIPTFGKSLGPQGIFSQYIPPLSSVWIKNMSWQSLSKNILPQFFLAF